MTILQVFNRFAKMRAANPDANLSDLVVEKFGRQLRRTPLDAVMLSLYMDAIEENRAAHNLLCGMIEYFEADAPTGTELQP